MLGLLLAVAVAAAPQPPRTFRVDFFHTGNATEERFALDRLVLEPLPFPGNPARTLDDTNLGKYFFEVRDLQTNRVLYSRGFSSIYGEWETTEEARSASRTFSESLRFPAPERPVQVVLKKRGERNAFREIWTLVVDPADRAVDTARPPSPGPVIELLRSGDPAQKLDLLLLGDGYTAADRAKFERDARRLVGVLFEHEPFRSRRSDFNVWGLCPPSEERGVSRPLTGQHRRSRIGATYDAFGAERYVLTFENRSLRDVASFAPYDVLGILVNGDTYGGGGIFGLYVTVAAGSRWSEYIFVHELGHALGDLADEYFTSETAYLSSKQRPEPWEPNVTADPKAAKWADLVKPGTPLPTPWPRDVFAKRAREYQERRKKIRAANRPEAEMDALFLAEQREETALLGGAHWALAIGAFEGANYEENGYFRPQVDCIMFTRDPVPFCAVCQRALSKAIDLYTR
ncbi:IgA Peptidase M64 [Anaeromyxobacter oryzisoli]|uniref:IgA Peptidase M64 n=1 Tax=Anaeromyxobacter oryzisoli TaxID=2925408 RepID=UPI001F56F08D|nr:IgA Peptidase M64 [Anaeromyxobacter sp. SG63]